MEALEEEEEEQYKVSCCLIGVDDDESSTIAFDFYASHIFRPGGRAVLVHIVKPAVRSSNQLSVHWNSSREQRFTEEKKRVRSLQDLYEDRLQSFGIPGQINIIYYSQQPGYVLCKMAEELKCSMIVLGVPNQDHSTTGAQESSFGNDVEYVLRKAHCPVAIVRQENFEHREDLRLKELDEDLDDEEALKRYQQQLRKVSCPTFRRPSHVGGTPSTLGATATDHDPAHHAVEVKWKPRRHSNIVNPFLRLNLTKPKP